MLSNEFLLLCRKKASSPPVPREGLGECVSLPSALVPSGSDEGHMNGLSDTGTHTHCPALVLLFQLSSSYVHTSLLLSEAGLTKNFLAVYKGKKREG